MNKAKRYEIFSRLRDDNPHPTTELNYSTPFELLIAVILSAQATDVGVNKATDKLFPVANTPEAILALGVEGLSEYIKTIGLFNSKAKNVIETCRILIEKHGSQVPETREELEALPGVGRKTAHVVRGAWFGHSLLAVDTHVGRLTRRLGWTAASNPRTVEEDLIAQLAADGAHGPDANLTVLSLRLILQGRRVCTARAPKCGECVLADVCPRIGVA